MKHLIRDISELEPIRRHPIRGESSRQRRERRRQQQAERERQQQEEEHPECHG